MNPIDDITRKDFENIINFLIPFAQEMLRKNGGFFPFGASINMDGENVADGAYDNNLQSQNLMNILIKAYKERKESNILKAYGICSDCKVIDPRSSSKKKVDAILIQLEHNSGVANDYYLPYKKGFLKQINYGTPFASPAKSVIFATKMDKD